MADEGKHFGHAFLEKVADEHAKLKRSVTGLGAELNGLKGEVTAVAGSAKGYEANFKIWGHDYNLVQELLKARQERRDEAAGLTPGTLRRDLAELQHRVTRALDAAEQARRTARDGVRKAEAALRRQRAASADGARNTRTGGANVHNFGQTSAAIDRLEGRINALVRALG